MNKITSDLFSQTRAKNSKLPQSIKKGYLKKKYWLFFYTNVEELIHRAEKSWTGTAKIGSAAHPFIIIPR